MTDLVLHIGLSKCGSTTIQSRVFKECKNYLGRGGADRMGNALTSEFLRLSPVNRIPSLRDRRAPGWAKRALSHVEARIGGNSASCILSSEAITRPIRSDYDHLFRYLRLLREEIWVWGDVKVVLVLRSQAARIASLFAQRRDKIFNANQQVFEASVERYLRSDPSLDY